MTMNIFETSQNSKIVGSLRETIRLVGEVDGVIEVHWRVGDKIICVCIVYR